MTTTVLDQWCKHEILAETCSWCLRLPEVTVSQTRSPLVCGVCGDPLKGKTGVEKKLIDSRWRNVGECCASI